MVVAGVQDRSVRRKQSDDVRMTSLTKQDDRIHFSFFPVVSKRWTNSGWTSLTREIRFSQESSRLESSRNHRWTQSGFVVEVETTDQSIEQSAVSSEIRFPFWSCCRRNRRLQNPSILSVRWHDQHGEINFVRSSCCSVLLFSLNFRSKASRLTTSSDVFF